MSRTTGTRPTHGRLAFWGYTNARNALAAVNIARQLRTCEAALGGCGEITRFFWDAPQPVGGRMVLAVRGASGPPRRDGGWDDLATALAADDREFDTVVCASTDRVGRRTKQMRRLAAVADCDATVLCADQTLPDLPYMADRGADQLVRQFTVVLREHDHASADALVHLRWGCADA